MAVKKIRETNCFTASELQKLPVEMLPLGKVLRKNFNKFGVIAELVLSQLSTTGFEPEFKNHRFFLKNQLIGLLDVIEAGVPEEIGFLRKSRKESWLISSRYVVLKAIEEGQDELESAFQSLLNRDIPAYAYHLVNVGVPLGQLMFILTLCDDDIYKRIGSYVHVRKRNSEGGKESAETRRQLPGVVSSEQLRNERQELIEKHRMHKRNVVGCLAKKHKKSPGQIRKLLNRNDQAHG